MDPQEVIEGMAQFVQANTDTTPERAREWATSAEGLTQRLNAVVRTWIGEQHQIGNNSALAQMFFALGRALYCGAGPGVDDGSGAPAKDCQLRMDKSFSILAACVETLRKRHHAEGGTFAEIMLPLATNLMSLAVQADVHLASSQE